MSIPESSSESPAYGDAPYAFHPMDLRAAEVHSVDGNLLEKLKVVREELGAQNLDDALDKSLNIAHFVAETLADPKSKLLVERDGRYRRLVEFE